MLDLHGKKVSIQNIILIFFNAFKLMELEDSYFRFIKIK